MVGETTRLKNLIAKERAKLAKKQMLASDMAEQRKLKRELFELQNPGKVEAGRRIKTGLKFIGKKVAKGLKSQAKLIKAQQLREAKASKKRTKKTGKTTKAKAGLDIFAPLDI